MEPVVYSNSLSSREDINAAKALAKADKELKVLLVATSADAIQAAKIAHSMRVALEVEGQRLIASSDKIAMMQFQLYFADSVADRATIVRSVYRYFNSRVLERMFLSDAKLQVEEHFPSIKKEVNAELDIDYARDAERAKGFTSHSVKQYAKSNPYKNLVTKGKVTALIGPTGSCKSIDGLKPGFERASANGESPLYLVPRISHTIDLKDDDRHYSQLKNGVIFGERGAYAVANSGLLNTALAAIRNRTESVSGDEYEQLMSHYASKAIGSGTLEERGLITDIHNKTFARAKTITVADANFTLRSFRMLQKITGRFVHVEDGGVTAPMRNMVIYHSEKALIAEIQRDLDAGLNVYLYTDCSNNARKSEFDEILAALTPRAKSVKRLDKAGFEDPANKEYLSDLTKNITEQLVMASPSMNSSVSIESDHFDRVYVIGRGTTLPTELIQSPSRIRRMKEVRICITTNQAQRSINPDYVLESELYKEMLAADVTPEIKRETLAKPGVNDVIYQIVYENGMRANYAKTFYHIAMLHNYELSYTNQLATEDEEKGINAAKTQAEAQRIAQVAAEKEIDAAAAKKIREKDAKSRAEECKLYKYELGKFYKSNVTEDIVKMDQGGKTTAAIKNHILLQSTSTRHLTQLELIQKKVLRKLLKTLKIDLNGTTTVDPKLAAEFKAWADDSCKTISVSKRPISILYALGMTFDGVKLQKDAMRMVCQILRLKFAMDVKRVGPSGGPRLMVCRQSEDLATGLALHLGEATYSDAEMVTDENRSIEYIEESEESELVMQSPNAQPHPGPGLSCPILAPQNSHLFFDANPHPIDPKTSLTTQVRRDAP